jgi:hypothetical protein
MSRDGITMQLTPAERSLLLRYGYPFSQSEAALKACAESQDIERVPIDLRASSPPRGLSRGFRAAEIAGLPEGHGIFIMETVMPGGVFAFEGRLKKRLRIRVTPCPQGPAPSKRHSHQKHKPQNDLRPSAASCRLVRKVPKLPE